MKKTFRKLTAVVLALVLVLGCSSMAFAGTSAAPSVMIDGQYVKFTDAAPKNVDGRIMVPFTAIFEAMGAKVDYDQATKTVTADKDGTKITFVVGQKEIKVTADGKDTTKTMDVASFIDNSRTYVPTRFVAEAMGYAVGWDKTAKSVVIVDFDKLFANADKDFSILNKTSQLTYDENSAYKTTGDMVYELTMYKNASIPQDVKMSISADLTGTTKGMDVDMKMAMKINVDDFVKALGTAIDTAEIAEMTKALSNIDMQIKLNGKTGEVFLKCDALSAITGVKDTNVWYTFNIYEMYKEMGIDFEGLMNAATSGSMSINELLSSIITDEMLTVETYDVAAAIYDVAKSLLGDEAFKTATSGNMKTYTAKIDGNAITKALSSFGDTADLKAALAELEALEATIVVKENNGALDSYSISAKINVDGLSLALEMSTDAKSNQNMTMTMDVPEMMKLDLKLKSSTQMTTDKVDVTIPKDAKTQDVMNMMK